MKKILNILIISTLIVLIFCQNVFADEITFKDVKKTDWYYETVSKMVEAGFIRGYDDNTFKPQREISRIEYAKILFASLPMDLPVVEVPEDVKRNFKQEMENYWGADVIVEAVERGFPAYDCLVEEWAKPITRGEMATFTLLASLTTSYATNLSFYQDMGCVIGDYGDCLARDDCYSILIMFSSGIVGGTNSNRDYSPDNSATRAEACTIIMRLLDENLRLDVQSYNIIHDDAPFFNSFLKSGFRNRAVESYPTAPVDYSFLPSTEKGSYTGSKYGYMTEKEAKEVKAVADEFISKYIDESMSDLRKVCIAAEYIMANCNYGEDDAPKAYNAWGALVSHEAWCTGYSYAFKFLCDAMDIGCVVVPANENASNPSHQWNQVEIDGYWYVIDIQASDYNRDAEAMYGPLGDNLVFLVSGDTYKMFTQMAWDEEKYPTCLYDYFEINTEVYQDLGLYE